jgi:NitT/TauT family transport system substrate-binding protein
MKGTGVMTYLHRWNRVAVAVAAGAALAVTAACSSSTGATGNSSTSTPASTEQSAGNSSAPVSDAASSSSEAEPTSEAAKEKDKLTVRLNFTPWAMHAHLYSALNLGYYADENLDVTIEPAQPGQAVQFVGAGKEQIGLTDVTGLLSAAANGAPLVAIALDQPESPGAFFFLDSSGIKTAQDLVGKKLCQPANSNMHAALMAGLENQGIDASKLKVTNIAAGSEVSLVASGECDASEGFTYGQPLTLTAAGHPASSISVGELGLNLYGTVLFTNKDYYDSHQDVLARFLNATARGHEYAYEHMYDAVDDTVKNVEGRTVDVEWPKLELIYNQYHGSPYFTERWGEMSEDQWASNIKILKDVGAISGDVDASAIFGNGPIENAPEAVTFSKMLQAGPPVK